MPERIQSEVVPMMTVLVDIMLWRHLLHVSLPHALVACCGGTCAQAVLLASNVLTIKANLRDQLVAIKFRLALILCSISPAPHCKCPEHMQSRTLCSILAGDQQIGGVGVEQRRQIQDPCNSARSARGTTPCVSRTRACRPSLGCPHR